MGRIKGITVEIGGDTTGLDKALKSVNTTIKNTQSQLKDVERLLKLDPSHTELLSQKQKLLKESISATKEKLDSLKLAQEQAKQQLENGTLGQDKYDALQREIVETEQELERLAKEAADANTALTKIGEAGKSLEQVGDKITSVGTTLTTRVTAPIVALGTAAVKVTADFDEQMSKVAAISGATGESFDALREKAREMGAKTKFSATEAGQAFEYMAMAGWKTEDMLAGIEGIMNLAAASGEDLATTSDIVTDALTAFGLTAADSGHFADILAAASSNANTNVSMMGETFKYAAPIAGALGYSAEDTALAIGLMANSGIKASQAGTSLRKMMTELSGEIKISGDAIGEVTIQTTNADGSMRELTDILMDCREAFNGLSESEKASTAEALVGKTAMSGFLAIMNASEADVNKLSEAIANCDGASEQMANTMQDNLSGQITILKSALQELAIQIGDALMPTIRKIVAKIQEWVEKLQQMDEGTRNTILKLAAFAAAVGPVLVVVGKLTSGTGKALQAVSSMGKGILTFVNQAKLGVGAGGKLASAIAGVGPVGWAIIAVIALLTAAFVSLWKNNEEFRDKMTAIWDGIKEKFTRFGQTITDKLNALGFDFENFTEVLKAVWDGFCAVLAPIFEGAFQLISDALGLVLDVLVGLFDVFAGLFTGNWEQMWDGVKEIFSGIWDGIKNILSTTLDMLKNVANVFLGWFGTDWDTIWGQIKDFFVNTWNSIKDFFVNIWTSIKDFCVNTWNAIGDFFVSVWTGIRDFFVNTWNGIKQTFTNIWTAISDTVSSVWETIKNVVQVGIMFIKELFSAAFQILTLPFRFIWENCKEYVIEAWEAIKSAVSTTVEAVRNTLETVWNAIWTVLSPIIETIKTGITTAWEAVKSAVSTAVEAVKTKVTETWNAIWTELSAILETIKTGISTAWEAVKTGVTTAVNAVKDTVTTVWTNIKTTLTPIVDGIKTGITTAWDTAKTNVTNALNSIKSTVSTVWTNVSTTVSNAVTNAKNAISNGFNAAKTTVSNIFSSIKSSISNAMDNAKNAVSNAITAIKNKFNFSWSLPKLKLPHLSITGSFSINPPSVPHFSISWYKKAMEDGMILNSPTIFGMKGNSLLAGGEAGSETVVGTNSLLGMIRDAVASMASGTTVNYGGVTVNVYAKENQDVRALADEIEYRINNNVLRRKAALGT